MKVSRVFKIKLFQVISSEERNHEFLLFIYSFLIVDKIRELYRKACLFYRNFFVNSIRNLKS